MSENKTVQNHELPPEGSNFKEVLKADEPNSTANDKIERMILEKFKGDELQARIRNKLRGVITNELSKMSGLMRESISDWIEQEKNKSQAELESHKKIIVDEKLLESDRQQQELKTEIESLKRKIQLKDQENNLILQSLKQLMGSQNKK